jgi:hypothetical protein
LINESGSIGERVAQAAMQAGEESRAKVVHAGTDLAQPPIDRRGMSHERSDAATMKTFLHSSPVICRVGVYSHRL